jgi:peptidyl-dipeptidase Dcp
LFHEFGHGLHGMLLIQPPSLSGTLYWDFVELPSQVMENWCYEPEAGFATHYKTGEMIPMEYVQKLKKALVLKD